MLEKTKQLDLALEETMSKLDDLSMAARGDDFVQGEVRVISAFISAAWDRVVCLRETVEGE